MEFEVRLFDTTSLAADGSNIPRRSCEEYLCSTDYQTIIRDKVAIGGMSHKDRKLKPELKGVIGMDDQVLINDNALFYITKLYFKDNDNFLYARAKTFDPDLFAGNRRNNIINLIGMLESGVRMPVSVVIQALWSKRGVAEKIIRIKGFDFTQNPSFKGAGNIRIFSEIINDSENAELERNFSDTKFEVITREYSTESEITIVSESQVLFSELLNKYPNQESFSYNDIVKYYGRGSEQEKAVRSRQSDPMLRASLEEKGSTEDPLYAELQKYVDADDRDAMQVIWRGNKDSLISILHSVPESDPNRDQLLKARLNQFFRCQPIEKTYSRDPNTIADRVRTENLPRYTKLMQIIKSYKMYLQTRKNLTDDQLHKSKLLFLQDINLLVKEVVPQLTKGITLSTLYALQQYGHEVNSTGIEFSKTYRKLIIAERILQFPPKSLYGEWMIDARNFYQSLLKYTFGEGLPDMEFNLIKL